MRVVLVSHCSHPFGGGEEDLFDKMRWCRDAGHDVTWLSFANNQRRPAVARTTRTGDLGEHYVNMPPCGKEKLFDTLDSFRPDVVVAIDVLVAQLVGYTTAPWVAVFHYWSHLVQLGASGNVRILGSDDIALHPDFEAIAESAARVVVVSKFMQKVLERLDVVVPTVIESCPTRRSMGRVPYDPDDPRRTWLTFVNAHCMKGGRLVPALIKAHPGIPVRVILTEDDHDVELHHDLLRAVCARNNSAQHAAVQIVSRTDDMPAVYDSARMLVCASVVDETFGRVAAESLASGVPAAFSERGNLPFLAGDGALYVDPDNIPGAVDDIAAMFFDESRLRAESARAVRAARLVSEVRLKPVFLQLLLDVARPAEASTTLFFAPWHEQGLGTATRVYTACLERGGVRTSVLSFTPYAMADKRIKVWQSNPEEWVHPRVYYSEHTREHVTDEEVIATLKAFRVDQVVITETCWFRVFEIAELCRMMGVRVIGNPMIELVRRDELEQHRVFDALLASNRRCERLFADRGFDVTWVGFTMLQQPVLGRGSAEHEPLLLLTVGGSNLDGRKMGPAIVRAHARACARLRLSHAALPRLVLTSQAHNNASADTRAAIDECGAAATAAGQGALPVDLRVGNLTCDEVRELYEHADATLMPSKHEGLGMGFWEALCVGCPVVTCDVAPHNEIVRHGHSGWLLPGREQALRENPMSFVDSFIVDDAALEDWIVWAASFPAEVRAQRAQVLADYRARHSEAEFAPRLARALGKPYVAPALPAVSTATTTSKTKTPSQPPTALMDVGIVAGTPPPPSPREDVPVVKRVELPHKLPLDTGVQERVSSRPPPKVFPTMWNVPGVRRAKVVLARRSTPSKPKSAWTHRGSVQKHH